MARRPPGRDDIPAAPGRGRPGPAPTPRLWPRRLLIGAIVCAILAVLGVSIGYGYIHYRLNQIKKIEVKGEFGVNGGQPLTVLVAGSDSRQGQPAGASAHFGSAAVVGGQRSDVIVLIRINPQTDSASMLSIPRDTAVTLAGSHQVQKINVAFNNGPSELVQTLFDTFGIQINHVVQVTFAGVQNIDSAVGGVCMQFPYPVRDGSPTGYGNESGLNIPTAGRHVLGGDQALALIRSRYFRYYKNGEWVSEGTGDIGRIVRQHEFLRALAAKALHEAKHNPFAANNLATEAVHDVTVDKAFGANDILGLVAEMRSLNPSTIPSWTLPTTSAYSYHLGDYLMPDPAADQNVISQWLNYDANPPGSPHHPKGRSTSTTVAPSSVTVAVRNGSGKAGQAGLASSGLQAVGFSVSGTGDAPNFAYTASVVTYGRGGLAAARTVASFVEGGVSVRSDSSLGPGAVELITGSDFVGIRVPGGRTSATPTTAPPATAPNLNKVPPWDPVPCS